MIKAVFVFQLLIIYSLQALSQRSGYHYDDYPAISYQNTIKAKINFNSNTNAKSYRTVISRGYNSSPINFAGHYVTVFIGCGMCCSFGVIIDANTGEIYNIPSNVEDEGIGCIDCLVDIDNANFKTDSRLFIAVSCHSNHNESNPVNTATYFVWLWNESKKKFEKLRDIKKLIR